MAKLDNPVIVGVVSKVMNRIGYVVINDEDKCYNDKVYSRYSMANRVCNEYGKGYRVKPVYVEESKN